MSILDDAKIHGFIVEPKIIIPTPEIVQLSSVIDSSYLEQIRERKESLRHTRNSTIDFYESFFELHRVPFIVEKNYGIRKVEKRGDVHPFGLPIKKVKDEDSFFGSLNELAILTDPEPLFYYRSITLPSKPTEITKLAYTHEIAHSQLNHIKGIIKDYYNTEVISILLESIHALEADPTERLLYVHDTKRLKDLVHIIKELNKYHSTDNPEIKNTLLEESVYLQSTLEAYELFLLYYYGSVELKREILAKVQALFNQEITLEELLSSFDISLESSMSTQKLVKYIKR